MKTDRKDKLKQTEIGAKGAQDASRRVPWPGRKSCVKADKRQSRERGQIEGQPVLGTGRLNQAYPPVFWDERRYARAA